MIPTSADSGTGALAVAAKGPAWQFRTSSLLWLTFTAAMTLAYARAFGPRAMAVALLTPLVAAAIGAGLGSFTQRLAEAIYWAVIGATLGAICVIAVPLNELTLFFWPLLGAIAGGYAGANQPKVTMRTLLTSAVGGLLFYLWFHAPFGMGDDEFLVDLAFAPAVAVGIAGLVRIVELLRAKYRTSRDAWAAGLIFAVIAGNLWAAFVAPRLG